MKSHNAYHGCERCVQHGTWLDKVSYPEADAPLRNDSSFRSRSDEKHHMRRESSLLENLPVPIGMVSQFVLDPMHLVHLGVMKKLFTIWLKGPVTLRCRLGSFQIQEISENLMKFNEYIPSEFSRKCRPLSEVERWKATEFRQFLLYSGAVTLFHILPAHLYNHFKLLFVSIFSLSSRLLSSSHCDYACQLFRLFVSQFGELYGQNMLVYNVHNLIHLSDDVKRFGSLDDFSAFAFESYLGEMKRKLRKPGFPLSQIIRGISEMCQKSSERSVTRKNTELHQVHDFGSLPFEYKVYLQYKSCIRDGLKYSILDRDNCVRIGNEIELVRNLIQLGSDPVKILYEPFKTVEDFFQHPLPSSNIGVYRVSNVLKSLKCAMLSSVTCKYVRLPYKESFCVFPLVHNM